MKSRVVLLFILFCCIVSSCTSLSDKSEIHELFSKLMREIKKGDDFRSEQFFTSKGWESTLLFLGDDNSGEPMASFLSKRRIRNIKKEDESSYIVFLTKTDPVIGRVRFLVVKDSDSFKISKCIASK